MSGGTPGDPRPDPDDEAEVDETLAGGLHYPDEDPPRAEPAGHAKRVGPEDEAREDLKGGKSAAQAVKDAFPKP